MDKIFSLAFYCVAFFFTSFFVGGGVVNVTPL